MHEPFLLRCVPSLTPWEVWQRSRERRSFPARRCIAHYPVREIPASAHWL